MLIVKQLNITNEDLKLILSIYIPYLFIEDIF